MKQYIAPKSRHAVLYTESLVAMSFNEDTSSQEELARKKEYGWTSEILTSTEDEG